MDQRELIKDFEETIRSVVTDLLLDTWTCLPGIVQSFDAGRMTCVVQIATKFRRVVPNISTGTTAVTWLSAAPIPDVPVIFAGGGGGAMTFEPVQGDECVVFFSSRCIAGWWAQGGVQPQPVLRHHNLSDGFCLIGPRSLPNVLTNISANPQLRTIDGSTYVEVTKTTKKVNIVAPNGASISNALTLNLQIFTDNAAALLGGLTSGMLYQNGEDPSQVCIVL